MSAPTTAAAERRLRGYLLLPRPGDLVKAWIFPAAFAFGLLAQGGVGGRELLRAALVWVALELLIYQARYQWNDIRGFAADQRHPDAAGRGRLPGPLSRRRPHTRASAAVLCARLGLVALLALALPALHLAWVLGGLTVAVFGIAVVYESLRSLTTGSSSQVPAPLRPGLVALWVIVGGGYAVRGVSGLALAIEVGSKPLVAVAALTTMWAFGVAFVTARWALESLAFARRSERGELIWEADDGIAREHSLALARWLPSAAPGGATKTPGVGRLEDWRALRIGTSLAAPWNVAAIVAAAAAALTGRLLAGPAEPLDALLATACGGLLATAVLLAARHRWSAWVGAGVVLTVVLASADSPRPGLAALPWLGIVGAHLFFTGQSPRTLPHPLRSAAREAFSHLSRGTDADPGAAVAAPLPRRSR
jgi:hypothetical protein